MLIYSCGKKELGRDPLLGLKMGSEKAVWKKTLNNLSNQGLIQEDEYGDFSTYIFNGTDSFKVDYLVNCPYPTSMFNVYSNFDIYRNGILRNIEIRLKGDTVCNFLGEWIDDKFVTKPDSILKREILAFGPRKKTTVDKIRKHLFNIYGHPASTSDSLEAEYRNDLISGNLSKDFGYIKYSELVNGKIKIVDFVDTWKLDSMTLQMFRKLFYYDSCFKDTMYRAAHIVYKMTDYDRELERVQNEIRRSFKPNDLMSFEFKEPVITYIKKDWYGKTFELYQPLGDISRQGPEEKRLVTDVKFDIIYLNKFNEEVARIRNCIYDFKNGLGPGKTIPYYGLFGSTKGYTIEYNTYYKDNAGYEYIREHIDSYKWGGKGKIISKTKKVVFEDGAVLE